MALIVVAGLGPLTRQSVTGDNHLGRIDSGDENYPEIARDSGGNGADANERNPNGSLIDCTIPGTPKTPGSWSSSTRSDLDDDDIFERSMSTEAGEIEDLQFLLDTSGTIGKKAAAGESSDERPRRSTAHGLLAQAQSCLSQQEVHEQHAAVAAARKQTRYQNDPEAKRQYDSSATEDKAFTDLVNAVAGFFPDLAMDAIAETCRQVNGDANQALDILIESAMEGSAAVQTSDDRGLDLDLDEAMAFNGFEGMDVLSADDAVGASGDAIAVTKGSALWKRVWSVKTQQNVCIIVITQALEGTV